MQAHDTDRVKHDARCYSVQCVNCGQTFEATRSDASFCGSRCRVFYSRAPARKAAALEEIRVMALKVNKLAQQYKHSDDMFEAIQKLARQVNGAIGWFEKE